MKIERVKTGYLEENCYIISQNEKCLVVDPGDEFLKIDSLVSKYKCMGILITHRHFDHVGALEQMKDKYDVPIYDRTCLEEKEYKIDDFVFKVIYTPGHSKDSVSFYFDQEKIMFVGDFVFKDTIGRTDLEGGNFDEMKSSIEKLKLYPKNIILYPGHGETTTLEAELKNNIYF